MSNKGRGTLGTIAIILMCFAIFAGLVSMGLTYQYQWRLRFAQSHLDVAQAVSNAETQYQEVTRAIEILKDFPKEGNYDFWNRFNPKTNLERAWNALYEIKNYADSVRKLETDSSAYHIGVYNIQEKIQYFENEYLGAFSNYIFWGAGEWIGQFIGLGLGIVWIFCWGITCAWAFDDGEDREALIWILTSIPIWIALFFFLWVGISPVFYAGPT